LGLYDLYDAALYDARENVLLMGLVTMFLKFLSFCLSFYLLSLWPAVIAFFIFSGVDLVTACHNMLNAPKKRRQSRFALLN
jgi:hypothetical protein